MEVFTIDEIKLSSDLGEFGVLSNLLEISFNPADNTDLHQFILTKYIDINGVSGYKFDIIIDRHGSIDSFFKFFGCFISDITYFNDTDVEVSISVDCYELMEEIPPELIIMRRDKTIDIILDMK
jgi:hypothetical protein